MSCDDKCDFDQIGCLASWSSKLGNGTASVPRQWLV